MHRPISVPGRSGTDHESVTVDEMYEKYSMGVHVIIRRGSLAEPASAGELLRRLEGAIPPGCCWPLTAASTSATWCIRAI